VLSNLVTNERERVPDLQSKWCRGSPLLLLSGCRVRLGWLICWRHPCISCGPMLVVGVCSTCGLMVDAPSRREPLLVCCEFEGYIQSDSFGRENSIVHSQATPIRVLCPSCMLQGLENSPAVWRRVTEWVLDVRDVAKKACLNLVSDSAIPHYVSDLLPRPLWDHCSTGQL
jgi:hypothetical protein